jgi:glycosyltransferase involved in cell wall biosynthesis
LEKAIMISVIFSSYNGGSDLKRMLDSLIRSKSPPGGWEVIAVDNASTDGTGDVMRSYEGRLPITVLYEPVKGKNRALNRALSRAHGDFHVFTDDDVLVCEDWLTRWRETADAHPEYELFAGLTRALFPAQPPQWLLSGIPVGVVCAAHGPREKEGPTDVENMYGTNMAVRASVFHAGIRFCPGIGPDGTGTYAMGSDTEFGRRLAGLGAKCWFSESARVSHIVPPEHIKAGWILRRAYRWGRGLARMGYSFPCAPEILARKNNLKKLVYPFVLPFLDREHRWHREWQFMVDRGFEDGIRDNRGQAARWT